MSEQNYAVIGTQAYYYASGTRARFTAGAVDPGDVIEGAFIDGVGAVVVTQSEKAIDASVALTAVASIPVTVTVPEAASGNAIIDAVATIEMDVGGQVLIRGIGLVVAQDGTSGRSGVTVVAGVGLPEVIHNVGHSGGGAVVGVGAPTITGQQGEEKTGAFSIIGIGAPAGVAQKNGSGGGAVAGIGGHTVAGVGQLAASGTMQVVGVGAPAAAGQKAASGTMQVVGVGAPAASVLAVENLVYSYVTSATGGTGTTSRTFTGVSFGAVPSAGHDRYIVAVMGWKDGSSSSSVGLSSGTAGGVASGWSARNIGTSSSRSVVGIFIAGPVNTGTSGTIVFNWTVDPGSFHYISVYRVIVDQDSTTFTEAPHDVGTDIQNDPSDNVEVEVGGIIIAGCQNVNGSPVSWTGLTEDAENDTDSMDTLSVASTSSTTTQTVAIQANNTTETNSAMVAASWGP